MDEKRTRRRKPWFEGDMMLPEAEANPMPRKKSAT